MASKKKRIYFYVDGRSERALRDKIDQQKIIPIFVQRTLNGKTVTLDAIAKECAKLLEAYRNLSKYHIFIIDKEKRATISASEMETTLVQSIKKLGQDEFDLVVADIMFENWILSDIHNVSTCHSDRLKLTANSKEFEGKHGVSELDNVWIQPNARYSSDKVGNAKRFFKSVRPDEGKKHSCSFDKFVNILTKNGVSLF